MSNGAWQRVRTLAGPAVAAVFLIGSLLPLAPVVRAAITLTPAAGGTAMSADGAANGVAPAWTVLAGPTISLGAADTLPAGTITFATPLGFSFDAGSTPSVNPGATGASVVCGTPSSNFVTCTVTGPGAGPGSVTVSGLRIQPNAASPLAAGSVTVGGTAGVAGIGATLATIAGTEAGVTFTTPPGGGGALSPFPTQPVVTIHDAAGNRVASGAGASLDVTLSIVPGTGAAGATLTCGGSGPGGRTDTASAGIAAFTGCQIDRAGNGFVLTASVPARGFAVSSTAFNVTAAPSHLAFSTQPGGGVVAQAWATQPLVRIQDAAGATVTSGPDATAQVRLQLASNPGGGTLTCTGGLQKAAVAGVAAFAGCAIDRPGNGYTVLATATNISGATSSSFNVSPGAASALVYLTQPGGGAAGVAWILQPAIAIEDAAGNVITGGASASAAVTLGISSNPGGGTLTCAGGTTRNAAAGIAVFSGCAIDRAGSGYRITASITGLPGVVSAAFPINQGPPASLAFTVQPSASAAVGSAFASQPTVAIRDSLGGTVTSSTLPVTLGVTGGTTGATLSCTGGTTRNAVAGVAAFTGCSIDRVGAGYTITATSGLLSTSSAPVTITAGVATRLAVVAQPGTAAVGAALAPAPAFSIQDAGGNTVTGSSASVTLALVSNPGTATLTCTAGTTRSAVAGIVTFTGCSLNKVGSGYTVKATSGSLAPATTAGFDITPGAPSKLAFTSQPGGASAGSSLVPQPVVTIQDASGNRVSTSSAVTLAVTAGTGTAGAALSCGGTGTTVSAVAGTATFTGCSVDRAGTAYTLTASSPGLSSAVSTAITIGPGAAVALGWVTQPGNASFGANLNPQPVVAVRDAIGNPVTSGAGSTLSVSLSLGANPTGAVLTCSGGQSKAAVAGVATFSGCQVSKVGTGYTITAVASGVTGTTSSPLNVTPGPAYQAGFIVQPGGASYGQPFAPQPSVAIQDAAGNVVTSSSATVILAITPGTGPAGGVLTCTGGLARAAVNGVATFVGCEIDRAGSGVRLTATATGVLNATSSTFTIAPGAPTRLAFSTQPVAGSAGAAFTTQPVVSVLDAAGNVVTGSFALIGLAFTPGTGVPGATMTCTAPTVAAANGIAAFVGCRIDRVGAGYTLTASSTLLTSATSAAITVLAGQPAKLAFTASPGGGTLGVAFPVQPVVTIQDAGGNTVTSSTVSVTLAIASGTGTSGAALSCTGGLTKTAVAGVATFSGCAISKAGSGFALKASSGSLVAAMSVSVDVAAGPPAKLAFTTQPGGGAAGAAWTVQPVVTVQDAGGNTATSGTVSVTLAAGANTAGATLACTGGLTRQAVAGVVAFTGCSLSRMGTGYTLVATATALTSATSIAFAVTVGAPAKLVFGTQPGGGPAGKAFQVQPVVKIADAAGDPVTTGTGATAPVILSITAGTGTTGAALTCTGSQSKTASAGVATFAGCAIDKLGKGYTLTAAATGLTSGTSSAFEVTVGAAAKLVWTTQPGGGAAGAAWTAQPVITIQDAGGTTVTTSTLSVTLSITASTGTTGAALACTGGQSKAAVAGVATFAGCAIDKAGTGYTLTAKVTGVSSDPSAAFAIVAGASTGPVAFTTQPGGGAAKTAWAAQPVVTIRGTDGKTVTTGASATATVTLSITAGSATTGAKLACTGGQAKAAVAGVATFAGCAIDLDGTAYTLTATVAGLAPGTSASFAIGAGAGADPVPSGPLAIISSAKIITTGGGVTLTIVASGDGAGRTVDLQQSADGARWATIGTMEPGADGKVSVLVRPGKRTYYRARVAALGAKPEILAGPVRVYVHEKVILKPTKVGGVTSIARGVKVTFTATVRPVGASIPRSKVTFAVYRKVGSSWTYVTRRTVVIDASGRARLRWTFSTAGTWGIRVQAGAVKGYLASTWSAYSSFLVR